MPSHRIAALAAAALLSLCAPTPAQQAPPSRQPAAVTRFPAGPGGQARAADFPGLREALRAMAKEMPTSRAVFTCPISGKQVRVIRAGARWTVFPRSAVFLLLGEHEGECDLVFHSQQQYVQYLARNPSAAKHKPKPLRLDAALRQLLAPEPASSSVSSAARAASAIP